MRSIRLQPIMNGVRRTAIPKDKVNGWKHTCNVYDIHFYRRGSIGYILTPNDPDGATLEKFDYSTCKYLDIHDYDDFHKFYTIKLETIDK